MRILLVEDDHMIACSIRASLTNQNYIVDWIDDGRMVLDAVSTEHFDLLLLDLGLPSVCGLQILRQIRAHRIDLPVIIITARDSIEERVDGLDIGADDYLVKPFDIVELAARIRSTLRRSAGRAAPAMEVMGVRLFPGSRQVYRDNEPVVLSAKEYAIVEALMQRPGVILSRAQLEERTCGWGDEIDSNAIVVHIHSIRRKLGLDFVRNLRGVGYYVPQPAEHDR